MAKVYYWAGIIGDQSIATKYPELIQKLLQGDYKSADLDLKRTGGKKKLYSAKANDAIRLLFTTIEEDGKHYLLLLEEMDESHNYGKARFMNSKVLNEFLEQRPSTSPDELIGLNLDEQAHLAEQLRGEAHDEIAVYMPIGFYKQQPIVISESQQLALKANTQPLMLSGPPGSGKTCVGIEIIKQLCSAPAHPIKTIVYLTQSGDLLQDMKSNWESLPESVGNKHTIHYWNYETLLRTTTNLLNGRDTAEQSQFFTWVTENQKQLITVPGKSKKQQREARINAFLADKYKTYQALQIIGAHEKDTAILNALGRNEFPYPDPLDKKLLIDIYNAYEAYLSKAGFIDLSLKKFRLTAEQRTDFHIICDEAADLSIAQLHVVADLAHATADHRQQIHVTFCFDNRQSLENTLPISPYLKKIFQSNRLKPITEIQLKCAYRCAQSIVKFANAFTEIAISLNGVTDKHDYTIIESASDAPGEPILWLSKESELKDIRARYGESIHFAVITIRERIDRAKEIYGTEQVFTIEQIKGLEYNYVLIDHLIDPDTFASASQVLAKKQNTKSGRPKDGIFSSPLTTVLNAFFTGITRAKNKVIVYQPDHHKTKALNDTLKQATIEASKASVGLSEGMKTSTRDEWIAHGQQLLKREATRAQGQAILDKHHHSDASARPAAAPSKTTSTSIADAKTMAHDTPSHGLAMLPALISEASIDTASLKDLIAKMSGFLVKQYHSDINELIADTEPLVTFFKASEIQLQFILMFLFQPNEQMQTKEERKQYTLTKISYIYLFLRINNDTQSADSMLAGFSEFGYQNNELVNQAFNQYYNKIIEILSSKEYLLKLIKNTFLIDKDMAEKIISMREIGSLCDEFEYTRSNQIPPDETSHFYCLKLTDSISVANTKKSKLLKVMNKIHKHKEHLLLDNYINLNSAIRMILFMQYNFDTIMLYYIQEAIKSHAKPNSTHPNNAVYFLLMLKNLSAKIEQLSNSLKGEAKSVLQKKGEINDKIEAITQTFIDILNNPDFKPNIELLFFNPTNITNPSTANTEEKRAEALHDTGFTLTPTASIIILVTNNFFSNTSYTHPLYLAICLILRPGIFLTKINKSQHQGFMSDYIAFYCALITLMIILRVVNNELGQLLTVDLMYFGFITFITHFDESLAHITAKTLVTTMSLYLSCPISKNNLIASHSDETCPELKAQLILISLVVVFLLTMIKMQSNALSSKTTRITKTDSKETSDDQQYTQPQINFILLKDKRELSNQSTGNPLLKYINQKIKQQNPRLAISVFAFFLYLYPLAIQWSECRWQQKKDESSHDPVSSYEDYLKVIELEHSTFTQFASFNCIFAIIAINSIFWFDPIYHNSDITEKIPKTGIDLFEQTRHTPDEKSEQFYRNTAAALSKLKK